MKLCRRLLTFCPTHTTPTLFFELQKKAFELPKKGGTMSKFTISCLALVAIFGFACEKKTEPPADPAPAADAQPPVDMGASAEAATIMAQAFEAQGGIDKLKAVDSWTAYSSGTYMGMPYKATSTFYSGDLRMDIQMPTGDRMAMVMGSKNCWNRSGLVVISCTPDQRKRNETNQQWERATRLWPLKSEAWSLKGGEITIDGKVHASLTISKPGLEGEGILAFDPESRLLAQAELPMFWNGVRGTMKVQFKHYHPDCGIKMPREMSSTFGGQQVLSEKYGEFHCKPVDHNLFVEPVQVSDGTTVEKTSGPATVACYLMKGDYSGFGPAMGQLMGFMGKKKLSPMGAPMMIYVKAPPEAKKAEEYLTEVCMPVGAKPPEAPEQDGDFVLKGLAPTKVLAIYGQGAYAKKSGELAANLLTELAKRKLKATGAMRQMTYHDPGKTPADKQVSEMQIPIQ